MKWLCFTLVLLAAPHGIAATEACPEGAFAWTETQMFFGRGMPDGGEVSEEEWQQFVAAQIMPRFPDGFTVLDAAGFWKGCEARSTGVCERSKLLLVQYPAESGGDAKLAEIAANYIKAFSQQAVMRSDAPVCTRFYER